mmetsp:Transcript_55488/g.162098  ORF Transcript_55488/g.162098 Transcript_55488/m.162098 type:complete len:831 (-) Transcript_55488:87-2579(-)
MADEHEKQEVPAEDAPMASGEAAEPPAEPEKPKEQEQDAETDGRPKLQPGDACFLPDDTTLNVLKTVDGKLLTSLSDGGCQYLLAGARASAGLKSGRHMFEVSIVEGKNPSEPAGARAQGPRPRQLVRVGVSVAGSSLFLSDGPENVAFDSEGNFIVGNQKKRLSSKFGQGQVVACLLNLDEKSPNANTISLFCDGVRISEPQPLPEALRGKPLYPAVTYRNVTLQVNFGPSPLRELPFKCCTWLEAAAGDCEVRRASPVTGPSEVLLPIGLPDEATFDWLDQFLEQNKGYVELSDRAIMQWAMKSGIQRPGGYAAKSSNDKPDPAFGLPLMDDGSIKRVLMAVASSLKRNYVVMQVKGNLLAEERKATLARFAGPEFRTVAQVVMGEPPAEYMTWVQDAMLKDKKTKAEAKAKRKKLEDAKKKAEEERKNKAQEDRKKRLEAAKKTKDGKKEAEEESEKKEAEEEAKADTAAAEEEQEEIKVELTEEEKSATFRKKDSPDMDPKELASAYAKFAVPGEDESFGEIKFPWADRSGCEEYLRKWVLGKKLTQRIEDLQPSDWFKGKWSEWTKGLSAWKKKQQDLKDPAKKKAMAKKKEEEDGDKEKMAIDAEDLDVFAVEDVTDIGNGEPLFMQWVYEDWALLSLRFELHLLVHAFKHDVNDPDRPTFTENHLPYYYQKYFKKPFNVKYFGVAKLGELVEMIKDTVDINVKTSMIQTQLFEDTPMDNFVKLTEDHRRDRQRRLDAGDETALLKFTRPAPAAPPPRQARGDDYPSRGSYGSGGSQGYSSQKRPYTPASHPPAKQPRSTYGSDRYSGGGGGGGYAGGGGYYRR